MSDVVRSIFVNDLPRLQSDSLTHGMDAASVRQKMGRGPDSVPWRGMATPKPNHPIQHTPTQQQRRNTRLRPADALRFGRRLLRLLRERTAVLWRRQSRAAGRWRRAWGIRQC